MSGSVRKQQIISYCALHTYSHSMSRRDGRGVGEVVIVTKSKRKRLWGQLMSVHCGGIISLHFNKLVASQRFLQRV